MSGLGTVLTLMASLFFPGVVSITKAKLSGRRGPPLFQPWYDIARLAKKGAVYSKTSSFVYRLVPPLYLASIVTAVLFVPFHGDPGILSFNSDFIFFIGLLALGKFGMIVSALDTGSGFSGMGASREALYTMLVGPAFFMVVAALAILSAQTSFADLFLQLQISISHSYLLAGFCAYLLLQIALVENSRLPVDDPRTHLELTMIHEVMILDNSGFDLALIHAAGALKFALTGGLVANLLMPREGSMGLAIAVFFFVQLTLAIMVGLLESFRARNKLARNPQWLLTQVSVALLIFFFALMIKNKMHLQ